MTIENTEVKPDVQPPQVEPVQQPTADEQEKLRLETENLRKAKEGELNELRQIREEQKQIREENVRLKEQKELDDLDPYSSPEALDKRMEIKARSAAKQALKENNINVAAKELMKRYGIAEDVFRTKVLPRYTTVAGYETVENAIEDMEAAVRAAMPETVYKANEDKVKSDLLKKQAELANADTTPGSSQTVKDQAISSRTKLTDSEKESMIIENSVRAKENKKPLTEDEFIEEFKLGK